MKISVDQHPNYKNKEGKICLVVCPECQRENYMINVVTGICTWCGFDANEDKGKTDNERV